VGRHPVAVVIQHVTYTRTMEVDYLDLVGEGYMGIMQWQLGREMGTIPAFASRTQENQENLCRDGRSQDLPDSGFVRHKHNALCIKQIMLFGRFLFVFYNSKILT